MINCCALENVNLNSRVEYKIKNEGTKMDQNVYQAPDATLDKEMMYCTECGTKIYRVVESCTNCGAVTNNNGKSKTTAGLLAILLGGFGVHRFYLGQWWGVFYLLFFWAWIPGIVALIEGIVFLCTSQGKWESKYGRAGPSSGGTKALLIIVAIFVVTAFIGILAAVAIPAYQDYVQQATGQ
jgi:TM2 domain-containing membrane protein YozV